jgi:phage terminase large subunit-like protein
VSAEQLSAVVDEMRRRAAARIRQFFPDEGPHRRELYPKHVEFFAAGAEFKERLFMAANRIGKSEAGAYEVTCHLTGRYPHWWTGKRFTEPGEWWACGTNSQTTRDIVQAKLFGPVHAPGTGMIPGHLIESTTTARGLPGALEGARIKHVAGGYSLLGLKSYEQGRQSFEGTAKQGIWDDEEPPIDVYTEQLYRTVTTEGITLITFTPLQGMSDVVKGFLEPESDAAKDFKWFIQAGWKHVPHLDPEQQRALLATTPPHQIQARTEGEPMLGAGAIYPIAESDLVVPTRPIPDTWRRVYGMDVGWKRTAAIWAAEEPGSGIIELYSEHYMGQGEPASHAEAIRSRGDWMDGVIDPASLGSSQIDGRNLMDVYGRLGLRLNPATNTVESGLTEVWNLMVSGRLKVQEHLHNWRSEFRKYHRDEKGKIVKANDHLMDATRYLVVSGRDYLKVQPRGSGYSPHVPIGSWMGS